MDPLTMGLITGGANLLGNVFSSLTSAGNVQSQIAAQQQLQSESMAFNSQQAEANREFQAGQTSQAEDYSSMQAQLNRDYQTEMSNTAYQRASADMKAAGLNPMMMFGSGGAASSPSGSAPTGVAAGGSSASVGTPSVPMPTRTSPLAGIGDILPKVVSTAGAVQGLEKLHEETRQTKADADASEATAEKERLRLQQERYEALKAGFRLRQRPEDIETAATAREKYGEYGSGVGQPLEQGANVLGRTVQKLIDAASGPTAQGVIERGRKFFSSDQPRNFDERFGNWPQQ